MRTKRVNGILFEGMLRNGLARLSAAEEQLNALNVFPVADGDTGTNMRLTLENGLRCAASNQELGAYLKALNEGMLLGARGNSGVILSQLFKGIYLELSRCQAANPGDLRNALIRGYKVAYAAVVCPVEGTILTVSREGIEHIRSQIDRRTTVETLLSMYIAEMRKTLSYTPEILPVLKEAGVVDSGAMGYIVITEGMLQYLYGERLTRTETVPAAVPASLESDPTLFHENSPFTDGYCLEYLLQLMNDPRYTQRFQLSRFIEDLKLFGTSLVALQEGKRVKVHIHTLVPAKVISLSQEYGEFVAFKLENMQLQHNEHLRHEEQRREHKPLATVAVVNGDGMRALYTELGCDLVLEGGDTMNTSSQEFVDAVRRLGADTVVLLPNNKNSILAAQQAASLLKPDTAQVIPTRSMAEGYLALSMDIPDCTDISRRLAQMRSGPDNMVTLAVAPASRSYSADGVRCQPGDQLALLDDEVVFTAKEQLDAIFGGLSRIPGITERETCVVFRGRGIPEEDETLLEAGLSDRYPNLEISILFGGQGVYSWLFGIL